MSRLSVLLADDDADIFAPELKELLNNQFPSARVDLARTPAETTRLAREHHYNFILLDISFHRGDFSGLVLAPKLQAIQPTCKVIMMSSRDDQDTLMRCLGLGAVDFISKADLAMKAVVDYIISHKATDEFLALDYEKGLTIARSLGLTHCSQAMKDAFAKVAQARRSPSTPVLITGETGTGKDIIAKAINNEGKPFIPVDCGAVADSLAESAFFGHVKGAFTGAAASSRGHFLEAHGGDLFLDEVGNLKRSVQDIFLRAIQNQEITPLGGKPVSFSARPISATNENLEIMVEKGLFRRDLFERLRGISIHLPPLRDRMEDFDSIVETIFKEAGAGNVALTPTCASLLKVYSWPGNIRELKNLLLRMIATTRGPLLSMRSFPDDFKQRLNAELSQLKAVRNSILLQTEVPEELDLKSAQDLFRKNFIAEKSKRLKTTQTSQELASSLGVSRSTLYNHFDESQHDLSTIAKTPKEKL